MEIYKKSNEHNVMEVHNEFYFPAVALKMEHIR